MKKTYTKPEIFFESFSLSTNIASNCEHPFTLASKGVCGIPDENDLPMDIFDPSLGGSCQVQGGSGAMYDGFCYHVPTENDNLFNS